MLKCILCVFIILLFCVNLIGCDTCNRNNVIESPLKELSTIYDNYNNLVQQTLYNENTGEYFLKEYMYALQDDKWVCVDQKTTIINKQQVLPLQDRQSTLNIYYTKDLLNGPIIIMDNEYVQVSIIKYLSKEQWWEFGYELCVVNKTDKVITIMIDDATIMDINCKPLFTIDHIDARHMSYFAMAWDKDTVERCRIPYVDNIKFMVRVYDNEKWKMPALAGTEILIKQ